jgi:signal transduction histidine kinase
VNRYDVAVRGPELLRANQIEQQIVDSGGRSGRLRLDAEQWWQSSSDQLNRIRTLETQLLADATTASGDRSSGQLRRTGLIAAALTLVVLVALIVSLLIGRSMARSLRVLRGEALQVAQTELPQVLQRLADLRAAPTDITVRPRTVGSADEIGEVAEAFTAVHASAVSLALEQAAMRRNVNTMFVNLARRSQVLVERQLELLDQLESKEGDPAVLENLFRLDHLAARMRRNDESLLVLAGNENARRWRSPIAVSAAMLAAIAEIEQYPRVRHSADDTWHIVGHAAADIVHLLAELLENATAFSPPGTLVKIGGDVVGDHVIIEITDEGIGMSPEAIESANAILESPPAADVAASERMGLFVVSHLAARHGVRVRLRAAGRGVVASVWLPPELLAQPEEPDHAAAATAAGRPVRTEVLTPSEVLAPAEVRGRSVTHAAPVPIGALAGGGNGGGNGVSGRAAVALRSRLAEMPPMPPVDLVLTGHRAAAELAAAVAAAAGKVGTAGSVPAIGSGGPPPPSEDSGPRPPAQRTPAQRTPAQRTPAEYAPAQHAPAQQPPARASTGRLRRSGDGEASAWWSRAGAAGAPLPSAGAAAPAPPEVPVTGGTTARGLPVRVPMAQLPAEEAASLANGAVGGPPQRPADEPDPDDVSSTLARFYGGVRRAEAEETTQEPTVPAGPRGREEQR